MLHTRHWQQGKERHEAEALCNHACFARCVCVHIYIYMCVCVSLCVCVCVCVYAIIYAGLGDSLLWPLPVGVLRGRMCSTSAGLLLTLQP